MLGKQQSQCLGNLKGQLSEQLLQQFYQDLGQKANKINEIAQALEDQKKLKQAELNPPQKKQEEPKQQNSEKKDLKQSQVQERPQSSKQLKEEPVPQKQQQGKKIQLDEEQEPSLEALQNTLRDAGVEDSFFELMNGTPKQKAEGIQQLENYIDAMLYQFDAVLYFLKAKLKDWKEANLAINKELFAMLIYANDLDPRPFNKKSFPPLCKLIIEKITETRFKEDIQTIIRGSCESVSPKLVVIYLISQTQSKEDKNQKVKDVPPKTIGEIILQIVKIVDLVTMRYLPFRELLEFGKEQIQQINPVIKQASQELLKTLYRFIGQDLIAHLQDLPPLTLKALAAEFDKIAPQMNQESQLIILGRSSPQIANPIDQLPRQDISVPIQGIIKKLSDVQWNKRKEAVEELDRLLTQNGNRVQMNGLTELFGLLKSRLSDNNKGVIRAIIQITGRLAEACGKEFKNQGKQLICPLITLLSDKQVLVRQDVVASLEKIGVSIGADQVVSQFPPYLGQESSELKQDLLQYMLNHPDGLVKSETKQFILPLLNNLCDRVKETRQLAEQVIEKVIDDIGVDPFVNATKDMKPAVVQQIKQFLSKFGIDADDGRQRTGRTPKNKLNQSEKIPERKMKQSMTTKDLTSELNTSQEIRKERNERTPKKSMHQKSHKTLPQDTPSKAKPVFMDNNIIASQISVRELKLLRIQSDSVTNWVNETFPNQDLSDLQYYLKEDVHQLLFNYNYRENIKGLNAVKNACIQTLSKMDVIEMSDLLLKYILFKLYGQIVNPTILICLIQFIDQYLKILVTANYKFNEIESTIIVLILREIIYCNYDIQVDLIASIEKLTKPYLFLQRIINILKLNHQIVHQHLNNQKPRIDQQVCFVILQLSKYFDESLVQEFIQTGVQSKEVSKYLGNSEWQINNRYKSLTNNNLNRPQPVQVQKDPRDQYFQQLLDSLLSQSTSSKIESLMQINDLLTQNLQQNQQLFVDHADQICKCFHNLLSSIFTNRDNYPAQFIQFFLAALTRLYQVKPYVKALPYDLLCSFTEELIQRLLAEDEIKQQYDQGDNTVKQLNATTLRILENTNFDLIFGILFDTMIKYRRRNHQSKMVGLLLKCITRIAAKLDQNANQIRFDLMILKFHNFLSEFSVSPNFSLDEQAVKTIKVVLQQLVKLKGESIWEVYQIVERSNSQDQFLSKWIQAFLANIQYQPTQASMPESQLMNNTQNKEDQELKEIQDLLNKPQFLEIGINKLVDKIRKNPNLNWTKYVKDTQIQLLVQQQLVPQMQPNDPRALKTQQRGSQDVSAQQQQGQLKTPEYLMQKLNDMKNKVQTLVGTQPQQQYRK
ncbi:hypothetical protein pb186bvf_008108 [Paramecium bursaria]